MTVPNAPRRYDEWSAVFAALKRPEHDEVVRQAVLRGTYPDISGVVERTTNRLVESFNDRLRLIQDALSAELRSGSTTSDVERALANVRTKLLPLARIAVCATFPDTVRTHLRTTLDTFARALRENLERSARRDNNGDPDGALLATVLRSNIGVPWSDALTRPGGACVTAEADRLVRRRILS